MDTPKYRWHHVTPDRFVIGLLALQVFLLLSARFQWFWFNEQKGWTVLIAVGVVGLAVVVMLVEGLVCLGLRRRFQFGVRSLLVFMVTVSIPLGWFAWEMEKARRQRVAMKRIYHLGGSILYDFQFADNQKTSSPASLRNLLGNEFFWEVLVAYCDCPKFGDNEARQLEGMTKLEELHLEHTQISDAGLEHLIQLQGLTDLNLNNTEISDAGLEHLTRLPNLRTLDLDNTRITDAGLEHLAKMKQLDHLRLVGTLVTEEGVGELLRAVPYCFVRYGKGESWVRGCTLYNEGR